MWEEGGGATMSDLEKQLRGKGLDQGRRRFNHSYRKQQIIAEHVVVHLDGKIEHQAIWILFC